MGDLKKLLDSNDGDAPATSEKKEEKEEKEVQPANTTGSWSIEFETKGTSKGTRTKTDVEYKWFDPVVKSSQTEETKKTGSTRTTFHTEEQKKKMAEEQKKIDDMDDAQKAKLILDYVKKLQKEAADKKEESAADKKEESADKKE